MKRRAFLESSLTAGAAGILSSSCGAERMPWDHLSGGEPEIPDSIADMTIEELREDYRHRLFDLYLPFWERGGIDPDTGAVRCILNDDGTVAEDDVFIWYQGRALWVYSFLYNNLGQDQRHLDTARSIRDFMMRHMYVGNGRWNERTLGDGTLRQGPGDSVAGGLFAANGLAEFFKASQDEEDRTTMIESIWAAARTYDTPLYAGVSNYGGLSPDVSLAGFRSQGHSMLFIRLLSQYLSTARNRRLEELLQEHVNHIMHDFFNPRLGITNEYLRHNYSRVPGYEDYMYIGHAAETMWMIMFEAMRSNDTTLFEDAKNTVSRYIEMGWDYVFDGFGSEHYYVFDGPDRTVEKRYGIKTMWSHCELMIALMHIFEYTGDVWARLWYERVRSYAVEKFDTGYGVWRQAVDRFGRETVRPGIPAKRKGNFHQPRWLMLNLMSLDRMIEAKGEAEAGAV